MIAMLSASEVSIDVGAPDVGTVLAYALVGVIIGAMVLWFVSYTPPPAAGAGPGREVTVLPMVIFNVPAILIATVAVALGVVVLYAVLRVRRKAPQRGFDVLSLADERDRTGK